MGHPRSPARFGVAVTSTGGAYDWRYPKGLPTVVASGAGVIDTSSAPAGSAAAISDGGIIFSDDFTSYPLGSQMAAAGNSSFGWKNDQTGYSHVVAFGRPGGSSRSVEFLSSEGIDSQLGFLFAAPQSHCFFRFYVYYPKGDESPNIGPAWRRTNTAVANNNKWLRFGDGTDWASTTNRFGASTYATSGGSELLRIEVPSLGSWNSPGISSTWAGQSLANNALGQWLKMEVEVLMNTTTPTADNDGGHGLANGIIRVWRNDVLLLNHTNVGMAPANSQFRQGYLFGYPNAPADGANSKYYMTDFAVSLIGRV